MSSRPSGNCIYFPNSWTGQTPSPTSPERDAELLLPGKTEEAVKKIYVNRRAKAEKKGDKAMMARLDKALPVRIQRLRTQGANVLKVSPERLIPGTTIEQVENEYKKRRAAAVQKKGIKVKRQSCSHFESQVRPSVGLNVGQQGPIGHRNLQMRGWDRLTAFTLPYA
jgi:hypothetical protein